MNKFVIWIKSLIWNINTFSSVYNFKWINLNLIIKKINTRCKRFWNHLVVHWPSCFFVGFSGVRSILVTVWGTLSGNKNLKKIISYCLVYYFIKSETLLSLVLYWYKIVALGIPTTHFSQCVTRQAYRRRV